VSFGTSPKYYQLDIPFTFLCPNFFMQNFVNFYLCKNQSSIYLPAGDGKVSVVDVRDIAAVAVQALTNNKNDIHSGKAYTITGPESISYGIGSRNSI
jgi:uncharacterized protein YbjT (DUF2867 family)